ncbi:cytochrome c biogenesis CcdA family protein [Rhizobium hidalgonense]|uniref:Cytochrome C biogenesis protein n=1 Tax=Rhizobium hidalgonense TaxID=1538159 RepID=A0ABX4JNW8_9HYPH|nr:cytochrome c biogenesis CcdA family protein [Rhizobium hidalgonense]PDT21271.1 cytochrome C biogenesis protein [Rhizobium hidalgonense]PON07922.1 cytochrome C biogenesis protein [Rhizobium hidalgonense]
MPLALLAGILSILSPCVLPLVPVVLAGAVAEHRLAPLALAAGVALSFTAIGLFVATIGFSIGLDMTVFRTGAAVLLILFGAVLLVPRLQVGFATAAGPVSSWTQNRFSGLSTSGISGQFGVGLLLGAVWTPCVGPTLGAASIMAARGENLGMVTLTMLAFGIGTALPLLLLSMLSREALLRWRGRMMSTASGLKIALGVLLILAGAMTLTGFDRTVQTVLLDALPSWMLALTTAI